MEKRFFFIAATISVCGVAAQNITISKDSLKICNDSLSSFADGISLICNTSGTITLDSAFIATDTMDTTGSAWYVTENRLQVVWREHLEMPDFYFWNLVKSGPDRYRLFLQETRSTEIYPMKFTAQIPQRRITAMEIGGCLGCSGLPTWYPPFFRGSLILHFSSGQTISLRLYSDDLGAPDTVNHGEPCDDLACDTLNVRKILDRNGMEAVPMSQVATVSNGRVTRLEFVYNLALASSLPKPVKVIPPEIGNLTGLKYLTAQGNGFDSFPQQIGGCANLQTIMANDNGMTKLPDSIAKCTLLRTVSLEKNRLTGLPESFGNLKNLSSLSVAENLLTSLPSSMTDLDSLGCLFIAGNRLCTLPEPVITWIQDVHTHTLCARWEPVWPDSQECNTEIIASARDTRPAHGFTIKPVVREGGLVTVTFGPMHGNGHRIEIFDLSGRTTAAMRLTNGKEAMQTVRLDAVRLPAGWYCLRVTSGAAGAANEIVRPFVVGR